MPIVALSQADWHDHVARVMIQALRDTLGVQQRCALSLSGGNTPRALYTRLAMPDMHHAVDWTRVHLFWGDERYVSPTDPRSNFRMVYESWLQYSPIPPENYHPIPTDCPDPSECARRYELELRHYFGGAIPAFDLTLLGLGEDGHTASLFPGDAALHAWHQWVAVGHAPVEPRIRITLTLPVLNASKQVWFLVAGASKRKVLQRVWQGDLSLPASHIQPAGELIWWIIRVLRRGDPGLQPWGGAPP
ncbi:MAG: 6-phosphogluconolactonase, partial [Armatimonadota bacterium]